ncbi:MAG: heme exporter protein CcmD [Alphaproteobacteria bacterium]|nr:heme exporter protein CcmD [Alphaproteobacteria bacterium]
MREFLDMGGYGTFVWPAYGVTALILMLLVIDSVARLRRRLAELARLEGNET